MGVVSRLMSSSGKVLLSLPGLSCELSICSIDIGID